MASSARFSIGDPNIIQSAKIKALAEQLNGRGGFRGRIKVATFEVTQEAPDVAAEIIEGYTNIADDLDCATDLIHVVSSDADDDWEGVGAQAVRIWYLQDGDIYSADFDLDGQVHVHLAALGTIDRIIGMEIIASVNAAVPAVIVPQGDITIDVHATGTVYCTIVAGDLYSITATMWVPEGWNMAIASLIPALTKAPAAEAIGDNGINVYIDINGTVTKGQIISLQNSGRDLESPTPFDLPLAGEGYISLLHDSVNTGANLTPTHTVTYLLWED